jgi:PHP family Zn ribbon phosphoesterase
MEFVADLHLHSKFSRAVSPQMNLQTMVRLAQQKGIDILSASDFTHPLWFKELKEQLEEANEGIYRLGGKKGYFLLSTEIASIYKQGEKLRRIHNLVFAPSLSVVEKINTELGKRGCNLNADGRPIIGLSSKHLLELILAIDERCFLIPCHVWTPHFGVYGSASGFDSLEEAFGDMAKYIYGIETGLSSDPDMNWAIPELRNRSILSFSDAHSAPKMGREATVFELKALTFTNLKSAIMRPQLSVFSNSGIQTEKQKTDQLLSENRKPNTDNRLTYTIEFYPEEGKYHFSGHRNCKVAYGPVEVREKGTICPVCKRRMTEGVIVRLQQLADEALSKRLAIMKDNKGVQWHTDTLQEQPPFVKLVPLIEIVAESMGSTVASQKVQNMLLQLTDKVGSEIDILLRSSIKEIESIGGERIAEGIVKVRAGDIDIHPGYDGEYGKVHIWKVPLWSE